MAAEQTGHAEQTRQAGELKNGFMLLQGNRAESLRRLLLDWLRAYPLAPLENEVFVVQSNGIAQWLKHALAADRGRVHEPGCGIAAATEMLLPARLQWRAYRAVLGDLPELSLFDKQPLLWRLMQVLPALDEPVFAPLTSFLSEDRDMRKRYQLAEKLADLYDQYQVYRADWLQAWASGRDILISAGGKQQALQPDQRWQAALWRKLDNGDTFQLGQSRAAIHQRFLEQSSQRQLQDRPAAWPRRLIVFGVSSLPAQVLEVLGAMSRFSQVMVFLNNPCQFFWSDLAESRDTSDALVASQSGNRLVLPVNAASSTQPLLAAWGKQGRDYMRLLDAYDDTRRYQSLFEQRNLDIDLFEEPGNDTLLAGLQSDILNLRSFAEDSSRPGRTLLAADDDSVVFHLAHSPQREVEILQDQLLDAFRKDPGLEPRDVMVMVPDINIYAPCIQAVFGQIDSSDPRYIPFTIADQTQRQQSSLVMALEALLDVGKSRFEASTVIDILSVPAVYQCFGINEDSLQTVMQWIRDAGIRWGLDARQRQVFGAPAEFGQNSWRYGIERMLLGYAVADGEAWQEIEPYPELAGLDSVLLGALLVFLEKLEALYRQLSAQHTPAEWCRLLGELLAAFFQPVSAEDVELLSRLEQSLESWFQVCEAVGFDEVIPVSVVKNAWLEDVDARHLSQRFLAGAVNFATLMPMRAIPFRKICLLGMNDGDFPRQQVNIDFDLMALPSSYRPGDRSRREDSRYLFLEALLSAREQLYISWVAKSIKDNSERPPSVLVAQLRDYIAVGWSSSVAEAVSPLDQLTVDHPLQPFSHRYFEADERLFTYSTAWQQDASLQSDDAARKSAQQEGAQAVDCGITELTPAMLADFLRKPVDAFFRYSLNLSDWDDTLEIEDREPFALDHLQDWSIYQQLLSRVAGVVRDSVASAECSAAVSNELLEACLLSELSKVRRSGVLPVGAFGDLLQQQIGSDARVQLVHYTADPQALASLTSKSIDIELEGFRILGVVADVYQQQPDGVWHQQVLHPGKFGSGKNLKHYHLVSGWVQQLLLAACSEGQAAATRVIFRDAIVELAPVTREVAREMLQKLLVAFREGMKNPLPLACKTAFKWLDQNSASDETEWIYSRAIESYEGNYNFSGEREDSIFLSRTWPDFASMLQTGQFEDWSRTLYLPLFERVQVVKQAGKGGWS